MINIFKSTTVVFMISVLFSITQGKGQDFKNATTIVEVVKMNVLYTDVDNPIEVLSTGCESSKLMVAIDNGTINGNNGKYIINTKEVGSANLTIKCNDTLLKKINFRVKSGFDITATLKKSNTDCVYRKTDLISRDELVNAVGVKIIAKNSDFDVDIKITKFTLTVKNGDSLMQAVSYSDIFTQEQRKIIQELSPKCRLVLENIHIILPDGSERDLVKSFTIGEE